MRSLRRSSTAEIRSTDAQPASFRPAGGASKRCKRACGASRAILRKIQPYSRPIGPAAQLFFAAALVRFGRFDDVGQFDAVKLAPDICEPVPDISAQHEG